MVAQCISVSSWQVPLVPQWATFTGMPSGSRWHFCAGFQSDFNLARLRVVTHLAAPACGFSVDLLVL